MPATRRSSSNRRISSVGGGTAAVRAAMTARLTMVPELPKASSTGRPRRWYAV